MRGHRAVPAAPPPTTNAPAVAVELLASRSPSQECSDRTLRLGSRSAQGLCVAAQFDCLRDEVAEYRKLGERHP